MLKLVTAIVAAMILTNIPALADDAHHPPADSAAVTAPSVQIDAQPAPATPTGTMMGGMMGQGSMMGVQGGMMGCPMMGQGQSGMTGMMGLSDMTDMARHIDGHVAFLKAELKIAPAQEEAWAAFADTLRTSVAGMMEMRTGVAEAANAAPSLKQIFEQKERLLMTRLDNSKRLHAAWAKLDAQLTPEQRQSALQLIGPRLMMI